MPDETVRLPPPPAPPAAPPAPSSAPTTVPMYNPDNGATADIHPAEVDNMRGHGWRLAGDLPAHAPKGSEAMTDAELRKAIFDATGERPGPNTKRETLLEKYETASSR